MYLLQAGCSGGYGSHLTAISNLFPSQLSRDTSQGGSLQLHFLNLGLVFMVQVFSPQSGSLHSLHSESYCIGHSGGYKAEIYIIKP